VEAAVETPTKVRVTGSPEKVFRLLVLAARNTGEEFTVVPAYDEDGKFLGFDVAGELKAVKRVLAYRKRVRKAWERPSARR